MAKEKRKKKPQSGGKTTLKGRLDVVKSGMGFVQVEGLERDILVRPENLKTALDGDEVRVAITKEGKGRTEGTIEEVVSRKQTEFSGRLEVKQHFAFLIPDK